MRLILTLTLCLLAFGAPTTTPKRTEGAEQADKIVTAIRETRPKDYAAELQELRQAIERSKEKDCWDILVVGSSLVSIGVLVWTGILTLRMRKQVQKQADSANIQARAALDMLEEARTQTLLDSRPILIPTLILEENGQVTGLDTEKVFIRFTNIGRGPAFRIHLWEHINSSDNLSPIEEATLPVIKHNESDILTLQTTFLRSVESCNSTTELARLLHHEIIPSLNVMVEYEDVLETTWQSYFLIEKTNVGFELNCKFLHVKRKVTRQS